jgi:hypothetical protein
MMDVVQHLVNHWIAMMEIQALFVIVTPFLGVNVVNVELLKHLAAQIIWIAVQLVLLHLEVIV